MLRISVICGAINSGKTSFLADFVKEAEVSFKMGGVISPKRFEKGEFLGYDLMEVTTGMIQPILRKGENPGVESIGNFNIVNQGFQEGNHIIVNSLNCEILIIDEIGILELEGRGFRRGLEKALAEYRSELVLSIRESLVGAYKELMAVYSGEIVFLYPDYWDRLKVMIESKRERR